MLNSNFMNAAVSFPLLLLNHLQETEDAEGKQLYADLQSSLLELREGIKQGLASKEDPDFSVLMETCIGLLFSVRVRTLKWFAGHASQVGLLYDGAIQALKDNALEDEQGMLGQLHNSLHVALRTIRSMYRDDVQVDAGGMDIERAMQALEPDSLSFELFKAMLIPSEQPQSYLQQYFHFLRLGLILELAVLAAGEVLSHPQNYGPDRVAELSGFLARSTREMEICALQLGILQE